MKAYLEAHDGDFPEPQQLPDIGKVGVTNYPNSCFVANNSELRSVGAMSFPGGSRIPTNSQIHQTVLST